jgi:hypothetical protein
MKIKPGFRTSEFWLTAVSFIFSGLFLLGIIGDPSQKDELIRDVSHAVESCILIGGQFIILYNYISSRKQAKIEHDTITNPVIINEEQKNEHKPRTNTKRTGKTNKPSKRKPSNSKKTSGR